MYAATSRLNLSAWAITHRPLVHYFMAMLVVIGVASYMKLKRDEDPTFTIKAMTVRAEWPGEHLRVYENRFVVLRAAMHDAVTDRAWRYPLLFP